MRTAGRWFPTALAAAGLAGCAAPEVAPVGTVTLLEVAHVLTREEILTGQVRMPRADGRRDPVMIPMYEGLLASGMQSGDMVDGSVILGRTLYYWDDPGSGSVREMTRVLPVARGLEVRSGNVVEAERGHRFATVIHVTYRTMAEGKCLYATDDGTVSGVSRDALRPVGRNGAASLRCANLEAQGWSATRRCNGIEWAKPPQAGRSRVVYYGESRALDRVDRTILAPFLSCYELTP